MTDTPGTGATIATRPLSGDDLERCVAIDRALAGRARRGFFEARLAAALRHPERFIYVGVTADGELRGFALVRLQEGEYGVQEPYAVLDAIGVERARLGTGLGRALMQGLEESMRARGVAEIRSQLDWNNHALSRFLDAAGFALAPRVVLTREVAEPANF